MTRLFPLRLLQRWRANTKGVAALEFALVLPVMLLVYLGGFEASDAVATYRKLADTTVTLANVTAQYTNMTWPGDFNTVFNASSQVMSPYPTTNLGIVVSEIKVDNTGSATVYFSKPFNGATALAPNSSVTLPAGMWTASAATTCSGCSVYLILVSTSYLFTLPTGYAFSHALPLADQIWMLPRQSASITCTGC